MCHCPPPYHPFVPQPTIITGDWNMHHHLWSSSPNVNSSRETDCMVDWLMIHGYLLSNTSSQHTYIPHTSWGTLSVLDLTFTNGPATQHAIPSDWTIKPEFAFDSDHLAIQWSLFNNMTPISNCCGNRYNIKDTNQNAWSTAFVEILEHLQGPLNVLMDTNNPISITNLENAVSALTTAIIYTNEQVVKKCNPSPTAKLWWNKTLTETVAYIWQLWELQCKHLKTHGFRDPDLNRDIKRTHNLFKRQVQYAKGMWANETLEKATADEMWKLHRWTTGHRNYSIPAISRRPEQSPAIMHK